MIKSRLLVGVGLAWLALGALSGVAAAQQRVVVELIREPTRSFVPASITIAPGTTVVWRNSVATDTSGHTVTSDTGVFDSGPARITGGQEFSFTFNQVGTFPFHCIPHREQGMMGTIRVVAGAARAGAAPLASAAVPLIGLGLLLLGAGFAWRRLR